jgi:hypothetical protein
MTDLLNFAHTTVAERRLLLAEDGDRLVATARDSWDMYREL